MSNIPWIQGPPSAEQFDANESGLWLMFLFPARPVIMRLLESATYRGDALYLPLTADGLPVGYAEALDRLRVLEDLREKIAAMPCEDHYREIGLPSNCGKCGPCLARTAKEK